MYNQNNSLSMANLPPKVVPKTTKGMKTTRAKSNTRKGWGNKENNNSSM
jgi:hypothetical protein